MIPTSESERVSLELVGKMREMHWNPQEITGNQRSMEAVFRNECLRIFPVISAYCWWERTGSWLEITGTILRHPARNTVSMFH
jgi:hypothetical protein